MKSNFILILSICLFSCSKDQPTQTPSSPDQPAQPKPDLPAPTGINRFAGTWKVTELCYKDISYDRSTGQWDYTKKDSVYNSFEGKTVIVNDSLFLAARKPEDWKGFPWGVDSLQFHPTKDFKLINNAQGKIGIYSQQFDTLKFKYFYGAAPTEYEVEQVWVKQK